MFTFNEIDQQVQAFLNAQDIGYSFNYVGSSKNSDNWKHDKWLIAFKNAGNDSFETFDFSTGIGHRCNKSLKLDREIKLHKNAVNSSQNFLNTVENLYKSGKYETVYAVAPTAASVLYCLLLDAQAADESFNTWCSTFGYNADSMKDFSTYQACCKISEQLNKIFTREQLTQLSELLQDY